MNPYQTISLNPYQFQSESQYLLQKMVLLLQHRQELLHLKDHVVVTEAASEGGGSIWSTSKHGRETYRDPIFTER